MTLYNFLCSCNKVFWLIYRFLLLLSCLVTQTRYLDIWEPATLAIKRDGYSIKVNGPGGVLVSEKFSQSTIVCLLPFAFLYS